MNKLKYFKIANQLQTYITVLAVLDEDFQDRLYYEIEVLYIEEYSIEHLNITIDFLLQYCENIENYEMCTALLSLHNKINNLN